MTLRFQNTSPFLAKLEKDWKHRPLFIDRCRHFRRIFKTTAENYFFQNTDVRVPFWVLKRIPTSIVYRQDKSRDLNFIYGTEFYFESYWRHFTAYSLSTLVV